MLTIRASPTGAAIDGRRKEDLLILTIITVSRPGTNDDSIDVSILIMSIPTCFTLSIFIYIDSMTLWRLTKYQSFRFSSK